MTTTAIPEPACASQDTIESDRLLVQIAFTGAAYGLVDPVFAIATYLTKRERTKGVALLILGMLLTATKNYADAKKSFEAVLAEQAFTRFHDEARTFLKLLKDIQNV